MFKYIETNLLIDNIINSSNQTAKSFSSLLQDYKNNETKNMSGIQVKEIVSNMWSTISNAGKLKTELKNVDEDLIISFTSPNETSDSLFIFRDLSIEFKYYGKYQLLFMVDGIESPLSGVIEVVRSSDIVTKEEVNIFFLMGFKIIPERLYYCYHNNGFRRHFNPDFKCVS